MYHCIMSSSDESEEVRQAKIRKRFEISSEDESSSTSDNSPVKRHTLGDDSEVDTQGGSKRKRII